MKEYINKLVQESNEANDELYHHGIKGMKWGVRRYQNPDGTLTAEGKRRYGTASQFEYVRKQKKLDAVSTVAATLGLSGASSRKCWRSSHRSRCCGWFSGYFCCNASICKK